MEDEPSEPSPPSRAATFFGFEPDSLLSDVYFMIEEYTCQALDQLQEALLRHPTLAKNQEFVISTVDQLEQTLFNSIDSHFEKFRRVALLNIFRVPDDLSITPPAQTDDYTTQSVTTDQLANMRADVAKLEAEIRQSTDLCEFSPVTFPSLTLQFSAQDDFSSQFTAKISVRNRRWNCFNVRLSHQLNDRSTEIEGRVVAIPSRCR